jgi:transposase InsO family protein
VAACEGTGGRGRHPKKSGGILRKEQQVKYSFIREYRSVYAVKKLCRMLKVARSGYYAWIRAGCRKRNERDLTMIMLIRQIEKEHHGNYGVVRVHQALKHLHVLCSKGKVQRIMHEQGIKAQRSAKYRPQNFGSNAQAHVFPDLMARRFKGHRAHEIWLADMTYVRVGFRWAYLAVVMDLGSRRVTGWSVSLRPDAELACTALRTACARHAPGKGLIHHSDRGCQYTSTQYRGLLRSYGMRGSMSRKADPYDNAPMESFFKTLKAEWLNGRQYATLCQLEQDLVYFIDYYYNCKRLHSSIGYLTPRSCENARKPAI